MKMKKIKLFKVSYERFDEQTSDYVKDHCYFENVNVVNDYINNLDHDDDVASVLVEMTYVPEKYSCIDVHRAEWKIVELCRDYTKTWKNYAYMYYIINI